MRINLKLISLIFCLTFFDLALSDVLVYSFDHSQQKVMVGENTGANIRDFIANEWNIAADDIIMMRGLGHGFSMVIDKDSTTELDQFIRYVQFRTKEELVNRLYQEPMDFRNAVCELYNPTLRRELELMIAARRVAEGLD